MRRILTAVLAAAIIFALSGCGGTHFDNCVSDLYEIYQKYGQNLPGYEPHPCTFLTNKRYLEAQHKAYEETR